MATKSFSKSNPLDKLTGAKVTPTVAVPDEEPKAAVEPKKEPKTKRKVGRPKTKTEETKTIVLDICRITY